MLSSNRVCPTPLTALECHPSSPLEASQRLFSPSHSDPDVPHSPQEMLVGEVSWFSPASFFCAPLLLRYCMVRMTSTVGSDCALSAWRSFPPQSAGPTFSPRGGCYLNPHATPQDFPCFFRESVFIDQLFHHAEYLHNFDPFFSTPRKKKPPAPEPPAPVQHPIPWVHGRRRPIRRHLHRPGCALPTPPLQYTGYLGS